ncbi:MAG: SpoIIE family protein phosphatase [Pseudomonadota bacterium]
MTAQSAHIEIEASAEGRARLALIVDDSRVQRKILSASVARWGFEVREAASGDEALEICRTTVPDLILSDWMMPGMNGIEFCEAFRLLPHEGYSYFILLTSKSEKGEIAQGLEAGADDFLTKPVNADELRARIKAGERIVQMQRELQEKNRLITDTLSELQRLYDSVESDLKQAKQLQQSLVPDRQCKLAGADLSLMLRQCGHVGGDLVGYFDAQPGHVGLFAIDVSGHGISSALMTARIAGYLSSTAPSQNVALCDGPDGYEMRAPVEAIEAINELVLCEMETEHYFTMMLADIDLATGHVCIGQAGHPHPVVQRANGTVEHIGDGGFPVGLMEGVSFSQFEVALQPGDRLLIMSDGVVECPDPEGNLLDESGVTRLVEGLHTLGGPAFFDALVWKLAEFAGERDFPDDVSGILLEYQAKTPA